MIDRQARQKEGRGRTAQDRVLQAGDIIYTRNRNEGAAWISAKMLEATGSFRCKSADQKTVRKHQDQIRQRDTPI